MALRTTPTIAICIIFGVAAGVALSRPADPVEPTVAAPVAEAAPLASVQDTGGDPDSPYLVDQSDSGDADSGAPASVEAVAPLEISIESFAFSPIDPVPAGSTITVTNLDSSDHTLTARDGEFDTELLGQGQSMTIVVPDTPGTYEFFCEVHPSMTGELVVT